jgi:hypothetical protein
VSIFIFYFILFNYIRKKTAKSVGLMSSSVGLMSKGVDLMSKGVGLMRIDTDKKHQHNILYFASFGTKRKGVEEMRLKV